MAIWQQSGIQSSGISGKAGSRPRVHATAEDWGNAAPITDFWFSPENSSIITASITSLLTSHGWTQNGTLSIVTGSGANFLAAQGATPGSPTALLMDATGERNQSPFVFGAWWTMRNIRQQLGWAPTKLIAEWVSFYTTSSNADTTGGVGFVQAGGAIQTAAQHEAVVTSDGTNFILRSGTATTTATSAVDTVTPHIWRITLDMGTLLATFSKDGTAVGTGGASGTGAIAITQAKAPFAFGMGVTSSNVLSVGDVHIWYDV